MPKIQDEYASVPNRSARRYLRMVRDHLCIHCSKPHRGILATCDKCLRIAKQKRQAKKAGKPHGVAGKPRTHRKSKYLAYVQKATS